MITVTAITEKFSKQTLDDVTCNFQIPYQTRSKTRALQQNNIYNEVFTGPTPNLFSAIPPSITTDEDDPGPEERPRSKSHTFGIPPMGAVGGSEENDDDMSITPPNAPPKKRHCRSMSAGEVTERRIHSNRWKPRASNVWRPIQTRSRDGHKVHSPLSKAACFNYHRLSSHIPSNAGANSNLSEYSTPPDSPIPRPLSAVEGGYNPPFWIERCNFRPVMSPRSFLRYSSMDERDRMSESSGSVTSVSSCMSDSIHEMELRNEKVVQRCKSQPCVPVSKRGGKKRRRDEERRPKLDLFKMETERWGQRHGDDGTQKHDSMRSRQTRSQALHCKKSVLRSACRLKYDPEEFLGLKTIASSPGETNSCLVKQVPSPDDKSSSSSVLITPTCSPTTDIKPTTEIIDAKDNQGSRHRNVSKDDGYHGDSDCEETVEDAISDKDADDEIFPIDSCSDLDLEQIEKY